MRMPRINPKVVARITESNRDYSLSPIPGCFLLDEHELMQGFHVRKSQRTNARHQRFERNRLQRKLEQRDRRSDREQAAWVAGTALPVASFDPPITVHAADVLQVRIEVTP